MTQDNFADLIREKLAKDPDLARQVEFAASTLEVARQVYEARTAANLTQAQLAKKIGTSQSAIARIEDADYEGHSTRLLQRIASALGLALRVELYDPIAVPVASIVQEIEEVSEAQVVPWRSASPKQSAEWKNLKTNVIVAGLESVA
jgi:transcriptional regulator with XRE-family HTH domain